MALDVTAEAGLYSGAGDPLNGAQVRPVEMGESDCSPVDPEDFGLTLAWSNDRATFQA